MNNEIFKDIIGYEGYYQISNLGRVQSLDIYVNTALKHSSIKFRKGRILKQRENSNGYYILMLSKKNNQKIKKVHRLVAETFIPNLDNKLEVNHKNGDKLNNNLNNLEWCTGQENNSHAIETGLHKILEGIKCPFAKLTEKQVRIIKHALSFEVGGTSVQLAKMCKVNLKTINNIKNNKSWKHIKI